MKKPGRKPQPLEASCPLYMGCQDDRSGHHVWNQRLHTRAIGGVSDWLADNDGELPPQSDRGEGAAAIRHYGTFTVLAFWDNSVDKRPGSHSTFLLPWVLGFDAAVAKARECFPEVFNRMRPDLEIRRAEG